MYSIIKRCPRLAQAVSGSCVCTCFVIITQTSFLLPSIRLRERANASNESRIIKEKDSAKKRMWSAPEEKQLLTTCCGIEIAKQLDNCVTSASVSSGAHRKCSFSTLLDRFLCLFLYSSHLSFNVANLASKLPTKRGIKINYFILDPKPRTIYRCISRLM